MNKSDFCIATITWARNEAEELVLKESLQKLAALTVPVFITDGGSNTSFLEFIKRIPHFTLMHSAKKGVQAQALNSLGASFKTDKPFIFYTEPDKTDFFLESLMKLIAQAEGNEATGIIMAGRTAPAFTSFPLFQQMTETTINKCCADIIKKEMDYTYGPFLLNRNLIPYLADLKEDVGWGWRPYIFAIANRLGYSVEAVEGDFYCPADQRLDVAEDRLYRMKQLEQNIRGLVLSTAATL